MIKLKVHYNLGIGISITHKEEKLESICEREKKPKKDARMENKAQFDLTSYNYQLSRDLEHYAKTLHKRDVNMFIKGSQGQIRDSPPVPAPAMIFHNPNIGSFFLIFLEI